MYIKCTDTNLSGFSLIKKNHMPRLPICALTLLVILSSFQAGKKPKLPDGFEYIPAGTYSLPVYKPSTTGDSSMIISVQGFYMSKYEVTNKQYREFFAEVSPRLSASDREKIAIDSAGWEQAGIYVEPLRKHYHSHPSFDNYPLVNLSYEGALRYCEWLQQKIQKENPELSVEVRLPSRTEWIWAAMGGRSQSMYPWGNYRLRNKKGEPMCNFKMVGDHAIYRNRKTGRPEVAMPSPGAETSVFTSAVKSFYPNDYGLYNMCGNAAEMVSEKGVAMGGSWNDYGGDVHTRAEAAYDRAAPTVGFRPVIIVKAR